MPAASIPASPSRKTNVRRMGVHLTGLRQDPRTVLGRHSRAGDPTFARREASDPTHRTRLRGGSHAEDLMQFVRSGLVELRVGARGRLAVRAPALEAGA